MGAGNSTECSSTQIDFSSYKSACLFNPDLESFNAKICDITTQAINSLAVGIKDCSSPSLESVIAVNNSFGQVTEAVVKVIDDEKEDIWMSKQLCDLVKNYFRLSFETLDLCTSIEECLDRARDSQRIIKLAVLQFDEEQPGNVGVWGSKKNLYSKTLESLEEFKMNDELFTQELFDKLDSLIAAQDSMLKSLDREIELANKKLNIWQRVCLRIFGGTSYLMTLCKVTLLRIRAPQFLIQLIEAPCDGMESLNRWLNQIWGVYEKDLTTSMRKMTFNTINELNLIRTDVNHLKTKIKALRGSAMFAITNQDANAVKLAIAGINEKLNGFKEVIQKLEKRNDTCRTNTRKAIMDVLDKIRKYSGT